MDTDTLSCMSKEMADVLREAIRKSGLSAMQICRDTGVAQPTVTEFLRGKDIRLHTAQALVAYFGLELKPKRARRHRKK